jgi:hypothetical protein
MSSVIINERWNYDNLFPILMDAFRVLYIAYQNLLSEKPNVIFSNPKGSQLENTITNALVVRTIGITKRFTYRIQKQQEDFVTNVKIDIAVLYSLTFDDENDDNKRDLKIECKRLDNLYYFINDGISSFQNNKYTELPLAGMLAFNTTKNISQNIKLLNSRIKKKFPCDDILENFTFIDNYLFTYKSVHTRDDNSIIDLYTLALDFKDVIAN